MLEPARRFVTSAAREADRFGHPYVGPEHLLLALLRDRENPAARVLYAHGLTPELVEVDLARLTNGDGSAQPRGDAELLADLGIDLQEVRRRAISSFGADAVSRATRRVVRRPRWRGGSAGWTPMCGKPLLIKRALELAERERARSGDEPLRAEDVLLGLLRDAQDPVGTQLSRGSRKNLSRFGLTAGGPTRVRSILAAHQLTPEELHPLVRAIVQAQS